MTRPKKKSKHTFLNHSRLDVSPKKPLRAILRDGPIENLWGDGRTTKKIFMQWPKKNSYKVFDTEKKFLRLKNSPPLPPITFLMVRALEGLSSHQDIGAMLGQFCAEVIA